MPTRGGEWQRDCESPHVPLRQALPPAQQACALSRAAPGNTSRFCEGQARPIKPERWKSSGSAFLQPLSPGQVLRLRCPSSESVHWPERGAVPGPCMPVGSGPPLGTVRCQGPAFQEGPGTKDSQASPHRQQDWGQVSRGAAAPKDILRKSLLGLGLSVPWWELGWRAEADRRCPLSRDG